ncbi:MAG: hypothetical protein U0237_07090 [Thermoleophilia bacterium]
MTVTAYGLPAAAPVASVPVIAPVEASIDRPGGRPVADQVSAWAGTSGSVAVTCSETGSPSPLDWSATGSTSGAAFTSVTSTCTGSESDASPASVTTTAKV